MGLRFSDRFQRELIDGGISEERPLDSEPLWAPSSPVRSVRTGSGVARTALLAIAARSAEFGAILQLADNPSQLKNIVLTPTLFLWPDEGPAL